jgi:hypothetical protein
MSNSEVPKANTSFRSELRRIWTPGQTEQAWDREFMLSYAFYQVSKDVLWNLPRTVALTIGHTARRLKRQTSQHS